MSLVLSRTALLDIFLEFFVLAGFGALVVDRDTMRARLGRLVADGADLGRRHADARPASVAAARRRHVRPGLRGEVDGAVVLPGVRLLSPGLGPGRAARRPACAGPAGDWLRRSVLPALGSLLLAPVGAYLLTYLGWFVGENGWEPALGRHARRVDAPDAARAAGARSTGAWVPGPIRSLGSWTLDAYRFHEDLDSGHPYAVQPVELAGPRPAGRLLLRRRLDTCGAPQLLARGAADRHPADVVGVHPDAALARLALGHHARLAGGGGLGGLRSPAGWSGSRT